MIWIEGGDFVMGSDHHYPEERPSRAATAPSFWMDRTPVTNRQFARFVEETGHRTVAELPVDPADYPGALPDRLAPASLVFRPSEGPVDLRGPASQWWALVPGADWRHPTGPGSSIKALADHPVVHVALADVEAYAAWAGASLPTETEWEYAARGGLHDTEYAWGDSLLKNGRHMANTWQGVFPHQNSNEDGWRRTSPVGAFPPNGYGLVDMIGNVWEWTADWWGVVGEGSQSPTCCTSRASRGPDEASHADVPTHGIPHRVLKGGSHLCAPSYCRRYRPAARHSHAIDTSTSHISFRCIIRAEA